MDVCKNKYIFEYCNTLTHTHTQTHIHTHTHVCCCTTITHTCSVVNESLDTSANPRCADYFCPFPLTFFNKGKRYIKGTAACTKPLFHRKGGLVDLKRKREKLNPALILLFFFFFSNLRSWVQLLRRVPALQRWP
uniref:Uncharacterized protein n=1 Tax=Trypanosoma congolense (strain IL3000) TaxID=1068625 RepID=G0ULV7_TRYCI|nr:hypothetical protein, unlikely [Trypanosoma congolense IL3000]